MRILFFSPYFYPYTSGITTYPFKILSRLALKDDITILTFPHDKNLPPYEKIGRLKVNRLPYLFKFYKGFVSPQSIFYFVRGLKKTDAVVINIPNFEGLLLAILARLYGKKTIAIFHCYLDGGKNALIKTANFFANLSSGLQMILSDVVVAYTKDYVRNSPFYKFIGTKLKVTLPPVENVDFDKATYEAFSKQKNRDVWIGYAGRISTEKGLEYLIEATKQKNVKLVFAGPYGVSVAGENQYYQKILSVLKKNRIKHKFLGNLSGRRLASFYKAVDLLVLPSINRTEAFGMVQPEAMMAGTPVIASNLPGVRVPIKLTKMGILIEPKNVRDLTEAVKTLLKNKNKYANVRLTQNAKAIFDIKKVFQFYDDLFHKKIS